MLTVIFPIFALLLAGYAAGKTGYLKIETAAGLSDYIYLIAVPVLLFQTIVTAKFPALIPWAFWVSYFVPVFIVWLSISLLARLWFKRSHKEASIIGFATGQANTVLMGIPLILTRFGDQALVPIAFLISVHLAIMMSSVTILVEMGDETAMSKKNLPLRVSFKLMTHPILIGIICGLLFRLTGLGLAVPFAHFVALIAKTAIPVALISMGLALNKYNIGRETKQAVLASLFKLIVHPALVWIMVFYIFSLPVVWAGTAVLFAACPSGINGYVVARNYGKCEATTSSMITISTGMAFVSMSVWLILLETRLG